MLEFLAQQSGHLMPDVRVLPEQPSSNGVRCSLSMNPTDEGNDSVQPGLLPRIMNLKAQFPEVVDIPYDERKAMFQNRGGNLSIGDIERRPRRRTQRSATASVIGRIRPANHSFTSTSSHCFPPISHQLFAGLTRPKIDEKSGLDQSKP